MPRRPSSKPSGKRWIAETLFDRLGLRMTFAAGRVRHEERTAHQHLMLFDHRQLGHVLMLDGATQLTGADEFIYHEMMSHVPILAHGRVRDVLIVGGGDCGIARQVLKHGSIVHVTQVEIDEAVVAIAKRHFPELAAPVLADRRFELVIADGNAYVRTSARQFDIVIVDSGDPQGPNTRLFGRDFYAAVKRRLAPGGVLVTQSGVPFLQPDELVAAVGHWRRLFADASCYVAAVPTYVGGHLAMGWATDNKQLRRTPVHTIAARYRRAGRFTTRYWTPEVHTAAFALPRYIAALVERAVD
jgi:spermidine synthase